MMVKQKTRYLQATFPAEFIAREHVYSIVDDFSRRNNSREIKIPRTWEPLRHFSFLEIPSV